MDNMAVKNRKSTNDDRVGDDVNISKGTKPLEPLMKRTTLTKNMFCLVGNLFGIQSSQNADVGPQISLKNGKIKGREEAMKNQQFQQTKAKRKKIVHQTTQTQWTQLLENKDMPKKSLFWAYVCWLFGGFFGIHLFYLERDAHAFLTWSTLGGYGLGWLADVTKIPRYVRDCNNDPRYLEDLMDKMRRNKKPPFSVSRFISAVMVGYLWGLLVMMAIPENEVWGINWNTYLHWLIPLAVALGVWVVGNIGREQGKPWLTIAVSYLTYTSRWYYYDDNVWLSIMMFVAAITFDTFSKEWRRTPTKKWSFGRRAAVLTCCAVLYLGLWSSYLYFNGKITDSNGDEIPVHEAFHHFFTSSLWTDFKESLFEIYTYAQHHGWYEVWKQVIDLSDPHGEQNAYKVLGVSPTASQQEITARWRALSRENHPDKCKDPNKLRDVQEKFMEIQQAYEILSKIKNKRHRKNKQSVNDL